MVELYLLFIILHLNHGRLGVQWTDHMRFVHMLFLTGTHKNKSTAS